VCATEHDAAFRALNERIREVESGWHSDAPLAFVCECTSSQCTSAVYLTAAEYAEIRLEPLHVLVLPGHATSDERIVRSNDRVAVVERVGAAKPLAPEQRTRERRT
jgi:hypothetical protein